MNFKELGESLGLEEDEYRQLIDLFLDSGGTDFRKLQEALAEGNADQVMRRAHTIKGASGNLGLEDVSTAASIIEQHALQNQLEGLSDTMRILKDQFEAIQTLVQ